MAVCSGLPPPVRLCAVEGQSFVQFRHLMRSASAVGVPLLFGPLDAGSAGHGSTAPRRRRRRPIRRATRRGGDHRPLALDEPQVITLLAAEA